MDVVSSALKPIMTMARYLWAGKKIVREREALALPPSRLKPIVVYVRMALRSMAR